MSRSFTARAARSLAAATVALALTASVALAGEITGNGKPTPIKTEGVANSICAFSGQNDGLPPPGRTAAHVQNWGQIPKAVRDELTLEGAHPGDACNGHSGFLAGG